MTYDLSFWEGIVLPAAIGANIIVWLAWWWRRVH